MTSFLFDVFAGDHDGDLAELCKGHTGPLGLIRWSDLDGKGGQTWRDLARQLGLHKRAVSITDTTPTTGVRALKRAISSGSAPSGEGSARREEVEAERQDVAADEGLTSEVRSRDVNSCFDADGLAEMVGERPSSA